MNKTLLVWIALAGSLLWATPGSASFAVGGCSDPVCVTGDVTANGVPNFTNNSSVDAAAGPWDTGINSNYGYGDGAQGPATTIALSPNSELYTVTWLSGTTTTNTSDNPPTNVDANGYGCCQLGLGSNAPAAYIPGGSANLNELVGTFADSSGTIVGTPFVVGNGPTLIGPSPGATQLQLGINDNQYSDNAGRLNVAVQGFSTGGGIASTIVGNSGTGNLTITGGNTYVTGTLDVGSQNGSDGTVDNGGTVDDDAIIGDAGTGTMNNTSTHNVTGNLILGNQSTGNGTYTITGNTAQTTVAFANPSETPNGALIVGNAGTGTFTQGLADQSDPGNQVTVAGDLALGLQSGSTGTYTLNDGTLTVGGAMLVGGASTNANVFTQNGGTVTLTGSANGNGLYAPVSPGAVPSTNPGTLYIGGESVFDSGTGTYNLNGGTLNAGSVVVGVSGTGTVNQSGGSVSTGYLDMGFCGGCNGGNSAGFYNLSGTGTVTANNESVGDFGHAEFVQGSDLLGTTTNTVNGTLSIGNSPTATPNGANPGNYDRSGTYTLDSGTLSTNDTVVGSQGTGTFIQNGGTHSISDTLNVGQQYTPPSGPAGSGTLSNPVFGGAAMGTYDMNGGTLTANNGITVGDAGNGVFNHTGGSVTSGLGGGNAGNLVIGNQGGDDGASQPGGQGTYNLGQTGQAQTPTLQVFGDTILGNGNSASGALPASGTLNIAGDGTAMSVNAFTCCNPQQGGNILVGLNGTGAVTQTDASALYMDHDLVLGVNAGSSGSYTLGATSLPGGNPANLTIGSDLNVGGFNSGPDIYGYNPQTAATGGTGTFTQTSGDVFVIGSASVGSSGGTGTYALSGGTFTSGNNLFIGNNGGTGGFVQTGGIATVGTAGIEGTLGLGSAGGVGTYSLTGASSLTVNGSVNIAVDGGSDGSSMTIGTGTDSPVMLVQSTLGNGNMVVGGSAAGSLTINSGSVTVEGITNVGYFGTGTVTQTGGAFESGYLDIGIINTTGNTYTLSNGTVNVDNDLVVGNFAGSGGTFTQVSGTVNVNSPGFGVYINNGTYDLQSGNFNVANNVTLGDVAGGASFTQEGGSAAINDTLIIGNSTSVSGTYTLSGGTLTTGITGGSSIGDVVIGSSGIGELDNSGGTQISSSNAGLTLGFFGGSQGTYKLTGTGSLSVAGNENIGVFGIGVFQQGDGSGNTSNTVAGSVYISSGFGGPASSYTQTDGTLTVSGSEIVGYAAQGSFTQSGGTNSVTGGLTLGLLSNDSDATQFGNGTYTLGGSGALNVGGDVVLGSGTGTSGTFNYNTAGGAGTLSFTGSGQSLVVGDAGTGVFNEGAVRNTTDLNLQTSGTTLTIGRSIGGTGTFNLAAGSSLEDDMIVGDAGTGTFNNNGGNNTVGTTSTPASLIIGNAASGVGTYNNTAGTNTINGNLIVGNAGTGTYNLGNGSEGATLSVLGSGLSGGNVYIGVNGTGTVTASDSASAIVAGVLTLGGPSPGDTGTGTLTITDAGTSWINEGQTQVGGAGTGTVNVIAGGYFESHTGGSGSGSAAVLGLEAGSTGIVTVDGNGSEWNVADGALRIGVSSLGTGTVGNVLTISDGGSVIDNAGNGGDGALTDDGAAGTVGWRALSVGTVDITTGGTWTNNGDLVIGDAGNGTVNIDGTSSTTVGGNLILGNLASGNGTLNLSNGSTLSLTSGTQFLVGNAGTGVVNQNGGSLNLAAMGVGIDIGVQSTGTGTYNLNGGSLEDDVTVGDAGTGTFNNITGTHTVDGSLNIGVRSTGNGTYNLIAGTTTVSSFTTVGVAGTGLFLNNAGNHSTQVLVLGTLAGSNGTYTLQDGGTLTVGTASSPGFFDVGEHGTGTFNQSSGTTTINGAFDLGRCGFATGCLGVGDTDTTVGNGTVKLTGGSLSVSQFAVVGDGGIGVFNQSGGSTVTVGDELDIGRSGGTGTYTIAGTSSLTITTGDLVVGAFGPGGSGTLTQTGGTVAVSAGDTVIGDASGVTGTYTLSGPGSLSISGELYIGAAGNGTVTQSGTGSSVTASKLSIANNGGGVGNYNLSAGTLTINGTSYLGGDTSAQGTLTQTGGTAALNGDVNVGYAPHATGTYTLGGSGAATIAGNLDIGDQANANGTFNFNATAGDAATLAFTTSGKTMTVGDAGNGTVNQGGGDLNLNGQGITLDIGVQQGSNGHYNLTGGTLEDDLIVGDAGTGTFTNTGGTHTVNGNLIVGNQPTGNGTYTLGGTGNLTLATAGAQVILGNQNNGTNAASGTFNFNTTAGDAGSITFGTGQSIVVGNNGNGVFNQGGGDLNLRDNGVGLNIAANSGSFGQYNISGGSVETLSLNVGDGGSGQWNQSGGTATIGSSTTAANLVVGNQTGSSGVVSIFGTNPSLTVWGDATIGNAGFGKLQQSAGSTDIKGSMTVANSAAGGSVGISAGSMTVGDGGAGHQLLVTSSGSMSIEDDGTVGATVLVDGTMVNNGQVGLGLHDVASGPTLTVTQGLQNNSTFNVEGSGTVNANVTNGSASNSTAYFTAQNGSTTLVAVNGNMDNFALVNVSSLGGGASSLTQTGNFTNEATGTLQVIGSNLTIKGTGTALDNFGAVNISQDVNGPSAPISTVAITGNVMNESTGHVTLTDAKVTVTGNVDNAGQFTAQRDPGNVNVASNVTVTGTLTNEANATVAVSNSTMHVSGNTINNGTFNVSGSTMVFTTFTNNGAYHSDPSSSHFTDLTVTATGYLTGGTGDVFDISGNFHNTSTQSALWNTSAATVEFSTGNTPHIMDLVGLDEGAVASGFTNNFAWGDLDLDSGNSLSLAGAGSNALYVSMLEGLAFSGTDVTNIFGNGFNIYYDPTVDTALGDQTYALENGGLLCAIGSTCTLSSGGGGGTPAPEPGSLLLLSGGLAGLAFVRRRMARSGRQGATR